MEYICLIIPVKTTRCFSKVLWVETSFGCSPMSLLFHRLHLCYMSLYWSMCAVFICKCWFNVVVTFSGHRTHPDINIWPSLLVFSLSCICTRAMCAAAHYFSVAAASRLAVASNIIRKRWQNWWAGFGEKRPPLKFHSKVQKDICFPPWQPEGLNFEDLLRVARCTVHVHHLFPAQCEHFMLSPLC